MNQVHRYEMGVVGNCSFIAYVDTKASVRWLCWPRFDSPSVFGALLDEDRGGECRIAPVGEYHSHQYYIENTNILCTEFRGSRGRFRVIDLAPRFAHFERMYRPLMLVRKIEILEGSPALRVVCKPRFDYGQADPVVRLGSNHLEYAGSSMPLRLTTDLPLTHILEERELVVSKDRYLVLTYGPPLEAPLQSTAEEFLRKTCLYWQGWIKSSYIPDIYQEEVIRSALVLKMHQYEDTGGIIASGTTSLPEHQGSERTWDYRYCWFRDAYYTLKAFNEIGHFEELEKYFEYIQNILSIHGDRIQPLYSISGQAELSEEHLPLAGYLGNQPVRVGNNACLQIQNDVYGQLLVSLLPLFSDRRLRFKHNGSRQMLLFLLSWIERTMDEPDAGLWEFRNIKAVHTYTMLFHWAGSKAAIKIGAALGDLEIQNRASALAVQAGRQLERSFSPEAGAYMQAIGSRNFDASTLKLITMNYLNPDSERARNHLRRLEEHLRTDQGLFYRYVHPDDFGTPRSTFLICAFWYADALATVGRIDDARRTLDGILQFRNELGIFSEDIGLDGSQWGNYPQTYSHVGLINSAFRIARKLDQPAYQI